MKSNLFLALAAPCVLFLASCGSGTSGNNNKTTTDSVKPLAPVTLVSVSPSPDFPDAKLEIKSVKADKAGKDSAKVTFNFDIQNYELKLQTTDNGTKNCNNSDKGQHIHFILDNGPYKALYEPSNEVTLPNDGKEHIMVAFLSRSYHESIKNGKAAVMYHFKIDEKGNLKKLENPKTPMITYSRPKGDYIGKDTSNILLDFYLWNCDGKVNDGMWNVKADISNEDKPTQKLTATIDDKFKPHFIQNLYTGKCKVTLTLVDKDGKPAEGPQTSASRSFVLKAQ